MSELDSVHRFLFEKSQVRGQVARLRESLGAVLATKDYPSPYRSLLGEALAAVALLADTVKIDGSLILQLQGDGPVNTLVAQATDAGELRGLVHWNDMPDEGATFVEMMGSGRLVMTIDGEDNQRYQGVVEIGGGSLAEAIEIYFSHSEQLPTRIWLGCDGTSAGGILLQQMPESAGLSNDWDHLITLTNTISTDELVSLLPAQIIHRLFHLEDVRVFAPGDVHFHCSCSREKIEAVLIQLGQEEVMRIAEDDGEVRVDCEFCNFSYGFDAIDISALFLATNESPEQTH